MEWGGDRPPQTGMREREREREAQLSLKEPTYWLSVTFKVIQGLWFLCYLKTNMSHPFSDQ